ncbi:hypothetical protein B0T19DRAFT_442861 [Cercophora scortea]|uniref:SET domain-containing protein n=1 Tax=Cercophora scortea TaxID=314031 RepID=A0AAE0IDY7_9PEZI|nr:hypothetical protein B0T19DRAFT_442861 [Cercophora scortea]
MNSMVMILYRILQKKNASQIPRILANAIDFLETHYDDYAQDPVFLKDIHEIGAVISTIVQPGINVELASRLLPLMRANHIPIRMASHITAVGAAFNFVSSTINHSCDPNIFLFFEGNQIRVRSLKKIEAGEELTRCYTPEHLCIVRRQPWLKHGDFFDCWCRRCAEEDKEIRALAESGGTTLGEFTRAQVSLDILLNNTRSAAATPNIYPPGFSDCNYVEQTLVELATEPMRIGEWPGHIDPMPSVRLTLGGLMVGQGQVSRGTQYALRGKLVCRRRSGPSWVNEMIELTMHSLAAYSVQDSDSPEFADPRVPTTRDADILLCGYLYRVRSEAVKWFGVGTDFYTRVQDLFNATTEGRNLVHRLDSAEFEKEFTVAQEKFLKWAGIPAEFGIRLRS